MLAYLPGQKLAVSGDLVYLMRGAEPTAANGRELGFARAVKEKGLKVEGIVQTWFLEKADSVTPYAALEAKVRLAEEKVVKK